MNLNKKTQNQLQLFFYFKIIESQIFYNRKEKYFYLIEQYLTETIYPNSFRAKFFSMRSQDQKLKKLLKMIFNYYLLFRLIQSPTDLVI